MSHDHHQLIQSQSNNHWHLNSAHAWLSSLIHLFLNNNLWLNVYQETEELNVGMEKDPEQKRLRKGKFVMDYNIYSSG